MKIAETIRETRAQITEWKKAGLTVGLVPTMGFLHEGHKSLMERSVKENDKTVVSIFVNPMQFGKNEDLESYPRDPEKDSELCAGAGVDLIFHPGVSEMYPDAFFSFVDMSVVTEGLCGGGRPGHFRGVCTVVSKLFHIVCPNRAYFGQKDAQQLLVIKKMVADLNFNLEVIGCPTVREADGLAKSSRNSYLTADQRKAAAIIPRVLSEVAAAIGRGQRDAESIQKQVVQVLESEPMASVEYVEIVDGTLLKPVKTIEKPALVAVAVKIGKTRLIDNYLWT